MTSDTDFKKMEKPQHADYLPLGQDTGLSIAVWENSVTLSKQKKTDEQTPDGKNKWETTQKITLSNAVLERLFVRIPKYYELTKKERK